MKVLPHEGVYVRLKPSKRHGVGVFAIRRIPKGRMSFEMTMNRSSGSRRARPKDFRRPSGSSTRIFV